MRKAIAYAMIAGAVGVFVAIAGVLFGFEINGTLFILGAVACFVGELILKFTR